MLVPKPSENNEYSEGGTGFGNPIDPIQQPGVDWADLVDRVKSGSAEGMEQLYLLFEKGVRFYLYRRLGPQELDDKIHDVFLIVVQAIRKGELREPERLMGFIRTIVRRQIAAHIDTVVHSRKEEVALEPGSVVADRKRSPEETAMNEEQNALMWRILKGLSTRDREILTRFYIREQSQEQICRDMSLTDTQFRLLKSRAKARFGELGKRRLESRKAGQGSNILLRTFEKLRH